LYLLGFFRKEECEGGSDIVSTTPQNSRWTPPPVDYLQPLSGVDLLRWELAPGDIFIISPAGKTLRLKRAGDVLEPAWRKHYARSHQLKIIPLVNLDRVKKLSELFKRWQESKEIEEQDILGAEFQEAVRSGLGVAGGLSLLDWATTCYELMKPDSTLVEEFQNQHIVLYRRGLLVSSLAVLFSIACGYRELSFLRDIYRVAWHLDAGLIDESFTYWVALACQLERSNPGEGGKFLIAKEATEAEHELFFTHPRRGLERAQNSIAVEMNFPDLLLSILHHHEKSDGSGFPEKLNRSLLSDWESLIVLADNLVDYREEVLEKSLRGGWAELWKKYQEKPAVGTPTEAIKAKILHWLDTSEEVAA
jgi:hypothetical protein